MPDMLLHIAQLGHPILRKISERITAEDDGIRMLVEQMLETTQHANGVGLAAPQLFEPRRLIVIASRPNPRYPHAPEMAPTALINPELLWSSDDREMGWEGCLSIPALRGLVPRHLSVGVRHQTVDGRVLEVEFVGFPARIFQHELDHLNGLLFIDRLETPHDLVTEEEYLRRQGNATMHAR